MTILSVNVVFASEINDTTHENKINIKTSENDNELHEKTITNENEYYSKLNTEEINIISSTNTHKLTEKENTKSIIQNSNINTKSETSTEQTTTNKEETKILIKNYSIVKERNLIIQLVNLKGEPLKNQAIILNITNNNYNKQTNSNGMVYLKISQETGKYNVKINYNGDNSHIGSKTSFIMTVYKVKTFFIIPRKNIIRGNYFIAYLKDKNGNPLNNALIKLTYKNKKINKRTNANGRIILKINDKIGKYKLKLRYNGGKSYLKNSKQIIIRLYNSKTKIITPNSTIKKGKYLNIYLKDNSNKILKNKKLTIKISKKTYKKTTNKEGKVHIKLNYAVGTYKIKVKFPGNKGYLKTSKTLKIKIIPNYSAKIYAKSKTITLINASTIKYSIRLTNLKGKPLSGKTIKIKTKCNNFTTGTNIKLTKKTIVLSSDNIYNKATDKKLLNIVI